MINIKKINHTKKGILTLFMIFSLVLSMFVPIQVYAAEATVTFGSNWYEKEKDETFPVGVYIRTESGVGDYNVTITYNPLRLKYISGANEVDEENGILTLSGTYGNTEIKYWLKFQALSGGDTELTVENAEIRVRDTENEIYDITTYGQAPIKINGEDTAVAEEERLAEEQRLEEALQEETQQEETQSLQETVSETHEEEQKVAGQDSENGEIFQRESAEESENVLGKEKKTSVFFNVYVVLVLVVIILVAVVELIVLAVRKILQKTKNAKESEGQRETEWTDFDSNLDYISLEEFDTEDLARQVQLFMLDEEEESDYGEPVIKVCDVTMEFHLSSYNPSGLKDYLIQMLKRQVSYRKLFALYHVSFNVYKGEIVGIIGTNGSGKSTLLKIVSGALKPTGGHIEVDRKKVQLLTLGTGFDMELTAKENVYLNGSIIGYSREFLDEHYEDIVEFAELQDFMGEKVKNFSSGMVSRLGFAIATAGDAAEILILDEVLSVGDEFFRKKSLKRIKEMIHGGSTVLMVSHGMGTILENCTKCVWIEKGELRMIGEPEVVCDVYRKNNDRK